MKKFTNILTQEELEKIEHIVDSSTNKRIPDRSFSLGRVEIFSPIPDEIVNKITKIVNEMSGIDMVQTSSSCVIYSNEYGEPMLPPHFDGDANDLIVDFQISSNTKWGIGINLEVYEIEDNSALIFNPNTNIHWRPHKNFKDGEYVKMMFLRFKNPNIDNDYSYARYSQDHEIFEEVRDFRNSLQSQGY
jgi:hypothetical protein